MVCARCAARIGDGLLACPACHALVHSGELKTLASEAENLRQAGDLSGALSRWRRALELLPPNSSQYRAVQATIRETVRKVDAASGGGAKPARPNWANKGGALGVLGLLLWKFKFLLVFIATKAKLLLLGLTKASTFFSMLLSLGVYWSFWGWKFALGVVLSIYVHEMGHVMMLRRYGVRATAPMFIPGIGAVIRTKQYPASLHEDARVGLAGPIWGLGAAVAAYLVYLGAGAPMFGAIAKFGAWVNLFNLLPIFPLDGGHAFRALSKAERAGMAGLLGLSWVLSHEGLLLILGAVAVFRLFQSDAPKTRDPRVLLEFSILVILLTLLASLPLKLESDQGLIQTTALAN